MNTNPIYGAIKGGHTDAVELLLNGGHTLIKPTAPFIFDIISPLHYAICLNHKDIVKLLLDYGYSSYCNNPSTCLQTPLLIYALDKNNIDIDIIAYILDAGADVNEIYLNKSPLGYAAYSGNYDAVKLLIDRGAKVNIPVKYSTPLYCAAIKGRVEIGQLLIDKGANINAKYRSKIPIIYAISRNCVAFVDMLIKNGVDININAGGTTPLILACESGFPFIPNNNTIELLINNGANVNDQDSYKKTPLHYAISESNNAKLIRFLIDHGADMTIEDENDTTPLQELLSSTPNVHRFIDYKKLVYDILASRLETQL